MSNKLIKIYRAAAHSALRLFFFCGPVYQCFFINTSYGLTMCNLMQIAGIKRHVFFIILLLAFISIIILLFY